MAKRNPVLLFLGILIPLLGLSFFLHTTFLQHKGLSKYGNLIVLSYGVNFVLAAAIYIGLHSFRNRIKNQIGFLFMAGSFLKFIVFFILFYPSYKADGTMATSEFAAFFVPYAICLIVETVFTAKMLLKMN